MPVTRTEVAAAVALSVVALAWIGVQLAEWVTHWDEIAPNVAADFNVLHDAAQRWVTGGDFYLARQLEGPYEWPGPWVLYPPTTLLLFVPFLWLPAVLWWVIPIAITTWAVVRHRPRPLAIAVILFCLTNPTVHSTLFWGNPGMWFVAALALGTHYGWPAVLILMKPTLAPFALFGIWRRSWWLALAGLALVSLLFLPMWPDYITVLRNADHPSGIAYSIAQVPAMLIPLAAWFGRSIPG